MKNYISHSRILIVIILISFQQRSLAQILTIEDRITTLLSQMTMEEKIAQLHQAGSFNTADNERLKIPGFIMADGPHGVRDGRATSFPVGIGMAAMWDRDVAYRIGVAMGKEFRGKGKHQALGPALDLDRDPRNGRSAETGGEDPYLTAQTTTAVTKGIQSTPTIATIKHFNVNHRENGRMTNNIIASKRMLTETNGLTFRTAVQEGGAFCVMNAYNLINGEKCAENSYLLTTILRDYWGFPFYVVSDWGSIWDTKKAITAGCDIEMGSNLYSVDLPYLVFNNLVSEETINRSARRVLRTKLLTGMLDYQPEGDPADVNSIAHQQLCLEAARKSIVLLKNENSILPLSKNSISKLALIGPSAAITQLDGGGSAYVTPFYSVSPKQGIESKLSASNVVYARGCDISDYDTSAFGSARSAAASADVVVFVGGLDPSQESEGMDRIGGSINLPVIQQDLIKTLAQVNSKLIVVIYSGGICGVMNSIRAMKGLLYAFYPGQESGNALADILFGDVNPSGKLPVTMPLATGLLPTWGENINEGLGGGYRWFDDKSYPVQFAFGTGLSYTTFSYSNLVVNPVSALFGSSITVSVDVKNTGSLVGEEVAQMYLTHVNATVPMPLKELKGFQRVSLNPGETKSVTFIITNDELYTFNETSNVYEVMTGEKTISVGTSSDSLFLSGSITIHAGTKKPDLQIGAIKMIPPYPVKGQKVNFAALVKNQGTGATTSGIPISIRLNGTEIAFGKNYSQPIPAAGMALIEADGGPNGTNFWNADSLGTYTINAIVDPDNTIDECVEGNNEKTSSVMVYPLPPVNIALNKPVVVTSIESGGTVGEYAVDGNFSTRWSSEFSDPQYIIVDFGSSKKLKDIFLYWETAYAKSYQILLSEDNINFTSIFSENNGDGGIDKIVTSHQGRYLKILGLQRATVWGYSLYEIVVHDVLVEESVVINSALPGTFELLQNYPNPFNPSTHFSFHVPIRCQVTLTVHDVVGKEVAVLVNGEKEPGIYTVTFDGSRLSTGVYFYTLKTEKYFRTRKTVLLK